MFLHDLSVWPATDTGDSLSGFIARPSWRGGHAQTIYGWANPRYFPRLPAATTRYFDVDRDARVLAHCHWQQRPWEHATILALHGLNGSSDAHYMRGIATKAFARGMNVVRLNQRNCGDTEHLSEGLFHSGLTADAAHVLDELTHVDGLPAIGVAGYSLGGNLALKLAGDRGSAPPALRRVRRLAIIGSASAQAGAWAMCSTNGISSRISSAGCVEKSGSGPAYSTCRCSIGQDRA